MKKITIVLLSIMLCICLAACSNGTVSSVSTTEAGVTVSEEIQDTTIISGTKADSKEKETTSKKLTESTSAKQSTTSKKEASKTTSTTKVSTTKASTTKKVTVTKKPVSTTAKKVTSTTSKSISCVVYIECSSILDNMQDLKAGHEAYVPSSGIIMSSTSVTLENGATAYDALKSACNMQGVTMNVRSSSYGKYIVGFNNIDEKDCGRYSGWKYKVNGTYPSKSCDKYTVKNGDRIEFTYVCNY